VRPLELPPKRRIERRELIALFTEMPAGSSITVAEVQLRIGIDLNSSADRALVYNVRAHCRDVSGFVVDYRDGSFIRHTDATVVANVLPRRRERIYRQVKRGIAETMAIENFKALSRSEQLRVLAYQSNLDTLALASHRKAPELVAANLEQRRVLDSIDPAEVINALAAIKQ
jgi:hypothetical protein